MKSRTSIRWWIFWSMVLATCAFVFFFQKDRNDPHPALVENGRQNLRVVSITPNVTEILFRLGAEKELVGISDFCRPPTPELERPRCGGLVNPNYERILALRPSILFLLGRMDHVSQFATKNGIQPVSVYVESFSDLIRETKKIGGLVHRETESENLVNLLNSQMERVKANAKNIRPFRCLIILDREKGSLRKMMAIGGPSYLSEMLETAGGRNIFSSQKQSYFYASIESIIALKPEVIFDLVPGLEMNDEMRTRLLQDWAKQPGLPAVQNHRIAIMNENFLSVPGPDMPQVAEQFQSFLRNETN